MEMAGQTPMMISLSNLDAIDFDGDGFGDNATGNNADECPFQFGVADGTDGVGCPLVNTDDDDGDGVYDEVDLCPEPPCLKPLMQTVALIRSLTMMKMV